MKEHHYGTFVHATENTVYIAFYFNSDFVKPIRTFNDSEKLTGNYSLCLYHSQDEVNFVTHNLWQSNVELFEI